MNNVTSRAYRENWKYYQFKTTEHIMYPIEIEDQSYIYSFYKELVPLNHSRQLGLNIIFGVDSIENAPRVIMEMYSSSPSITQNFKVEGRRTPKKLISIGDYSDEESSLDQQINIFNNLVKEFDALKRDITYSREMSPIGLEVEVYRDWRHIYESAQSVAKQYCDIVDQFINAKQLRPLRG